MQAIQSSANIILETVFNDASFIELINTASRAGYSTSLSVLFLDSIDQSLKRVAMRAVKQTGLLISDGNVKLNFNESFKNVSEFYFYFNRVEFIYTGTDSLNQFIMSFKHDELEMYHTNQLNFIRQFASYGLSRGRIDEVAYKVITKNENYNLDT